MPTVDQFYAHFFGPAGQSRSPFAVAAGGMRFLLVHLANAVCGVVPEDVHLAIDAAGPTQLVAMGRRLVEAVKEGKAADARVLLA